MNGHVRRIFNLEDLVEPCGDPTDRTDSQSQTSRYQEFQLLPKKQLMAKLENFENLINAMGALFYASKRMQAQVPCVF